MELDIDNLDGDYINDMLAAYNPIETAKIAKIADTDSKNYMLSLIGSMSANGVIDHTNKELQSLILAYAASETIALSNLTKNSLYVTEVLERKIGHLNAGAHISIEHVDSFIKLSKLNIESTTKLSKYIKDIPIGIQTIIENVTNKNDSNKFNIKPIESDNNDDSNDTDSIVVDNDEYNPTASSYMDKIRNLRNN